VNFTGNVTLSLASNPWGALLGGTTIQPALLGVATFPDLLVSEIGPGYTLDATSAPLAPDTSSAFDVELWLLRNSSFAGRPPDPADYPLIFTGYPGDPSLAVGDQHKAFFHPGDPFPAEALDFADTNETLVFYQLDIPGPVIHVVRNTALGVVEITY